MEDPSPPGRSDARPKGRDPKHEIQFHKQLAQYHASQKWCEVYGTLRVNMDTWFQMWNRDLENLSEELLKIRDVSQADSRGQREQYVARKPPRNARKTVCFWQCA